ncbi:MAG: ComF family protein [Leadbetterella sp.]
MLLKALSDFVFPRICIACQEEILLEEQFICSGCMLDLPKTENHKQEVDSISQKFWGKIHVCGIYCYLSFAKNNVVQNLLHALKYRNKSELGKMLGRWYSQDLKNIGIHTKLDFVIPIPLHIKRKEERNYNQSEVFAQGLSEGLSCPILEDALIKTQNNLSQTHAKSRWLRFKNTEGVFSISDPDRIKGKRIALVDDMLTTGSTLEEAGRILIENGCRELYIITLAAAY